MRHDNLVVDQGTTWAVSWLLRDPESREPIGDLSGWTAKAQARTVVADANPLFTWSTSPGDGEGTIVYEDSKVVLKISPEQSSAWTWRKAIFSVELTNPEDEVILLSSGEMRINPEITR